MLAESALVSPVPELEAETEPTISSYPNPSSGEFDVVIDDDYTGSYQLVVRDFSGNALESRTILKDEKMVKARIDLKQAVEGVYLLTVYGNGQTMNRKIVVKN